MNIASVRIKNFLSIGSVEIKPGKINQVCGANNAGKTSILKALQFALKGSTDGDLVKFGEDSAEVVVELADETEIRRRVSRAGKQTVEVKKDGMRASAPQAYLDSLLDGSAFNPLDLLDPKVRQDAILRSIEFKVTPEILAREVGLPVEELPPLDFGQHGLKVIDQAHRYFYQRRAEANREAAEKEKRYDTYKSDLGEEPEVKITRAEVQKSLEEAQKTKADWDRKLSSVQSQHEAAKKMCAHVEGLKNDLQAILSQMVAEQRQFDQKMAILSARKADFENLIAMGEKDAPAALPDDRELAAAVNAAAVSIEQVRARFADVERAESYQRQLQVVKDIRRDWEDCKCTSESLGEVIKALAGPIRERLMAKIELPVAGLEFKNGEFLVDGSTIENLSTSKSIKLAVGIARKLSKTSKLICIDGCEALDQQTFEALKAEIQGDGFTYFISVVGDGFNDSGIKTIRMKKGAASEVRPEMRA